LNDFARIGEFVYVARQALALLGPLTRAANPRAHQGGSMKTSLSVIVIAATLATACGGDKSLATAPSSEAGSRTATVASAGGRVAGETEITGVVEALPPSTAPSTFRAAGKTVITNASTAFDNGSFASLAIGTSVEVKGTAAADTITATRVEIVRAPAPAPAPPAPQLAEAEFTGTISALSGSASSFQFTAAGRVVRGDATTTIIGRRDAVGAFTDLSNGGTVEVKGIQRDGFVQASRLQLEDADAEPGDNRGDDEARVEGVLSAISGACPAIASSVDGTRFTTSASTRFDGAGCSAFRNGDRVEVRGTRSSDGSIAASRLEEK
jgi:Domain of unknown function (DUF5666)